MRDSELADYDQHPADDATEMHEQELDETTEMILDAEAENVEIALQRLASGEYGKCVDCGREIPRERLEAIPEAIRCIEDQARYEAMLKARWPSPPRDRTP
jgi:RNA polymerase-binding transcription factor DksA